MVVQSMIVTVSHLLLRSFSPDLPQQDAQKYLLTNRPLDTYNPPNSCKHLALPWCKDLNVYRKIVDVGILDIGHSINPKPRTECVRIIHSLSYDV